MGILKDLFSGGTTSDGLRVDYIRAQPTDHDQLERKSFDPNQPRGQPGNAGQFGPGGSSSDPAKQASPSETAANRVVDKINAGKPLHEADQDAIYNAVNHLDRGQLDALIQKLKLPAIQANKGGRTDAILDAVDAHAAAKPHPDAKHGEKIDLASAKPIDFATKLPGEVPGWDRMNEVDPRMQSVGAVLMRSDPATGKPQVMLREPTGHYGGFAWTWPQGRPNSDKDTAADVAHRELGEETGLSGQVIGHIPQTFPQVFSRGDHIENAYFVMRHDGDLPDIRKIDAETNDAKWVDLDQAHTLINQTTNRAGRERDLKVLDAVRKMVGHGTSALADVHAGKAFGLLVEKGFTGTVTGSNGAVYHYVDGKRVAGQQQYQAHLAANPHAVPPPGPGASGSNPAAAKQAIADMVNKLKTGSSVPTNQEIADLVHHFQHLSTNEVLQVKRDLGLNVASTLAGGKGVPGARTLANHVATILDHIITHPNTQASVNAPAASAAAPTPTPPPAPAPPTPPATQSSQAAAAPASPLTQVHNVLNDLKSGQTPAPADVQGAVAALGHLTNFQLQAAAAYAGITPQTGATRAEIVSDLTAHMNGFTGQLTASNGVIYHYQNGVRLATPAPGVASPGVVANLLQKFNASGPISGNDLADLKAHLPALSDQDLDSVSTHLGLGTVAQSSRAHVEASVEAHLSGQKPPQPPSTSPQPQHWQQTLSIVQGQGMPAIQTAIASIDLMQPNHLDTLNQFLGVPANSGLQQTRDALAKHLSFHGTVDDASGQTHAYVNGSPLVLKTSHPVITPTLQKMRTGQAISPSEQAAFNAAIIGSGFNRGQLDDVMADMGLPPIAPRAPGRTTAILNALSAHTGNNLGSGPASATPPAPPPVPLTPTPSHLGPTPIPPLPPPPPSAPAFAGTLPTSVNNSAAHRGKLMQLVMHHLQQMGTTAEAVLSGGNVYQVQRAIQGNFSARNHPSAFDVERAVKSVQAFEATKVIPPLFLGNTSRNGPNGALDDAARPKLSEAEKAAAQKYTVNPISWELNDALRTTGKPPADLADIHNDLQAAFAKATPFAAPVVCNREMKLSKAAAANLVKLATAAQAADGALMLPGYTSTTTGHQPNSFFQGNVRLVINATHGIDMDPVSHYPGSNELLLNHASQFKVTRVSTVGGKTEIHLDQIPPDQAAPMPAHDQAPAGVSTWAKGVWAKKAAKSAAAKPSAPPASQFKKFDTPSDCQAVKDYITGTTPHALHSNTAGAGEDTLLTKIMDENGKSGLPAVHDRAGIDALKAQGWTVGHRGVTAASHTDQFKTDPSMFNGSGIYGNGTYVCFADGGHLKGRSLDEHDTSRHAGGSYGSHVMRIAIPPTAKVISSRGIQAKRRAVLKKINADVASGKLTHSESRKLHEVVRDDGRLASLLGYDVINAGGRSYNYCVVLNRAICAVQRSNV